MVQSTTLNSYHYFPYFAAIIDLFIPSVHDASKIFNQETARNLMTLEYWISRLNRTPIILSFNTVYLHKVIVIKQTNFFL